MGKVAVLGAGNWGTALSLILLAGGHEVSLWVYDVEQAGEIARTRVNPFLPGYVLPETVEITTDVPEAVGGVESVLFAVRSEGAPEVAGLLGACLHPGIPVISATKGLIGESCATMSQLLGASLHGRNPIVALSGPNIAAEIARGVPTATVVASSDSDAAHYAQRLLMSPSLRVYTSSDTLGVEMGGALKNIIAIAAGVCDGLGFGDNSKAALLTRGLAEITRLGVRMGAKQETFMGLAGVGDLIVTCASPISRNHRLGIGLGKGRRLDEMLGEIGQAVEGVPTTESAWRLSRELDTPMPITEQVYALLYEGKPPNVAVADLMLRQPRDEIW